MQSCFITAAATAAAVVHITRSAVDYTRTRSSITAATAVHITRAAVEDVAL